jgi:hypothetical protein
MIRGFLVLSDFVVAFGVVLLIAVIAVIVSYIRLRDKVEVLEGMVNRLDRESASAAKISK